MGVVNCVRVLGLQLFGTAFSISCPLAFIPLAARYSARSDPKKAGGRSIATAKGPTCFLHFP